MKLAGLDMNSHSMLFSFAVSIKHTAGSWTWEHFSADVSGVESLFCSFGKEYMILDGQTPSSPAHLLNPRSR